MSYEYKTEKIYAVRFYTRSGNTKKLADAVAKTVSVEAKDVSVPLEEKVDILFLGCSYYAFDVDESVKKPVSKVADTVGVAIANEEFHCRGQFGKIHKNRPNAADLEEISSFAKNIISE